MKYLKIFMIYDMSRYFNEIFDFDFLNIPNELEKGKPVQTPGFS